MNPKNLYNKNSNFYEKSMNTFNYANSLRKVIRKLIKNTPSSSKVLDLGCGSGIVSEVLTEKFDNIIGLDVSKNMLQIYNKKFPTVPLFIGDFNKETKFTNLKNSRKENLPKFDFIISSGAVSEYGDLSKVIPLVHNLLKDNGTFINIGIKRNIIGLIQGFFWSFNPPGRKKFSNACKKYGFSVKTRSISSKYFPTSLVKYVTICRK